MNVFHNKVRWRCIFMVVLAVFVSMPCRPVPAAVIDTETVVASVRGGQAREAIHQVFRRADVRASLAAQGLDSAEARSRIDALSDEEVIRVAEQFDTLPAGGASLLLVGAAILALTIVFYAVVLLAVEATE